MTSSTQTQEILSEAWWIGVQRYHGPTSTHLPNITPEDIALFVEQFPKDEPWDGIAFFRPFRNTQRNHDAEPSNEPEISSTNSVDDSSISLLRIDNTSAEVALNGSTQADIASIIDTFEHIQQTSVSYGSDKDETETQSQPQSLTEPVSEGAT